MALLFCGIGPQASVLPSKRLFSNSAPSGLPVPSEPRSCRQLPKLLFFGLGPSPELSRLSPGRARHGFSEPLGDNPNDSDGEPSDHSPALSASLAQVLTSIIHPHGFQYLEDDNGGSRSGGPDADAATEHPAHLPCAARPGGKNVQQMCIKCIYSIDWQSIRHKIVT